MAYVFANPFESLAQQNVTGFSGFICCQITHQRWSGTAPRKEGQKSQSYCKQSQYTCPQQASTIPGIPEADIRLAALPMRSRKCHAVFALSTKVGFVSQTSEFQTLKWTLLGMVVHGCDPSTGEPEAGGLPWVQSWPGLRSEFKLSWDILKILFTFSLSNEHTTGKSTPQSSSEILSYLFRVFHRRAILSSSSPALFKFLLGQGLTESLNGLGWVQTCDPLTLASLSAEITGMCPAKQCINFHSSIIKLENKI